MAHGKLFFENSITGEQKVAPVGFSWTTFFFGVFPALVRLDWKNFAIQLGVHIGIALLTAGTLNLFVSIAFSFIYNKMYVKDLVESNWQILRYDGSKSLDAAKVDTGLDLSRFMKSSA
jgi:hypothetical protein